MGQHADLYNGYSHIASYRGTLTGGTVTTLDLYGDLDFSPAAVLIYPPSDGSLYVVLSTNRAADGVTDPTDDGTSDSNSEMLEVSSADTPIALMFRASTVKLIHSGAEAYRVVVLG